MGRGWGLNSLINNTIDIWKSEGTQPSLPPPKEKFSATGYGPARKKKFCGWLSNHQILELYVFSFKSFPVKAVHINFTSVDRSGSHLSYMYMYMYDSVCTYMYHIIISFVHGTVVVSCSGPLTDDNYITRLW